MAEHRKAIAVHHTDTSDASWDGPAAKAKLNLGASASYYRKAFAWQDPDKDETTKEAYKFIHHEVSADGVIGAANLTACVAGIAVLNGGRGGTTIPDADRKGVWSHLAGHLKDADREPPELKSRFDGREERFIVAELRTVYKEGSATEVEGYAAVFNVEADVFWFREIIEPGAFARAIREKQDVRALWNHNTDKVLGRTKNDTLSLEEDDHGLRVRFTPPDTQDGRDALTLIERRDVDQMSFSFMATVEQWDEKQGEKSLRHVKEVDLFDVSPVTFPAYEQTEIGLRTAEAVWEKHVRDAAVGQEPGVDETDGEHRPEQVPSFDARKEVELQILDLEEQVT